MEDQPWTSTKFQPPTVLDTYTFSTQPSDFDLHATALAPAHITVRNPPRAHLPPASDQFCEAVEQALFPESDTHLVTSELSSLVSGVSRLRMPKKRPSLHSLFTPSFLSPPISPTSSDFDATNDYILRARSSSSVEQVLRSHITSPTPSSVTSPRNSPPPAFLIDDDPFANLTTLPSVSSLRHTPPPPPSSTPPRKAPPTPRSPLTPSTTETNSMSFTRSSSTNALPSGISRTLSGRAIHAYQKPAFSSRPSLPSLHTLAKMDAVFTPKVRKGRVGAKLPAEPWDNLNSPQTTSATSLSNSQDPTHSFSPPVSSGITDFVSNLDSDFLDFSSDDDMDEMELTLQFYSSNYDTVPQFDSINNIDGETSMSDLSPPSLSRTPSSSLSSLTRSTSLTSTSSAGSSETHQWPSSFSHNNSMSFVESDSDIFNSPPDEYLSFSTSRNSSNAIADRLWPSHTRLDMTDLEIDPHDSSFSDVRYVRESEVTYEPGTSAGTIRPWMDWKKTDPGSHPGSPQMDDDEVVDGVGSEGQDGNSPSFSVGEGARETGGRANGGREGELSGNGRGRLGGRGDDDDENDPRRHNCSTFSTPSDSEQSDEDKSTDDYGEESVLDVASQSSSDDDVPLAQRIPTALQAQRALRRQVREERDNRRKERAVRAEQGASTRSRQITLRPGAGDPAKQSNMSSSQEAALHASMSMRRPRTKTLSSNPARPFSPEDLSRRLQVMEVAGTSTTRHYRSPSTSVKPQEVVVENVEDTGPVSHLATETYTTRHYRSPSMTVKPKAVSVERPRSAGRTLADTGHVSLQHTEVAEASIDPLMPTKSTVADRSRSAGRSVGGFGPVPHNPLPEGHRALRLMRSFHIPERRKVDDHISAPMPVEQKLGRSLTRTRPRGDSAGSHPHSHSQTAQLHPLSDDKVPPRRSGDEFRKLVKANPESKSARPSMEFERPSRPSIQRPPVPPLPPAEALVSGRGNVTQQRIFIGDMQRFNTVEISPSTNAGDVIEMVEAQGSLKGWVGVGNWMVWEFAQDFGMERPVRNFELLADIQASWNKDKMLNAFVIKLTPLAGLLSRSTMPSSSPTHAGYVDWESKRGKWTKRWLQLREHNLYLAKRDNGRDEVFLCSLSNFDAYFITRLHRSPQPFAFAVKSTDNLSFFENKADYLHVFCCGENQGKVWMEKILVARSYVLHQEKHVLFSPKASNGNAAGGALSRTGTRKASSARPPQSSSPHSGPLVSLARNDVFELGSLLHKQT